jgi:hypothetical protein
MIRALALTSVLLAIAGCGTQGPVKCTPSNCSGCCTENDECLGAMTQSAQACGKAGASCRVCLPQQSCVAGACSTNADASVILPREDAGPDPGQPDAAVMCGSEGQACCTSQTCYPPLACQRGLCQMPGAVTDAGACGRLGQQCCVGQLCNEPGTRCDGVSCVAATVDAGTDAGLTLKPLGDACTADAQCRDGACLILGFAGGYCTRGCGSSTDCPAGSQCASNTSGSGPAKVCYRQCSAAGQAPGGCRAGYVCEANAGTSGVPVCYPGCQSAATCGLAPTCDTRGFCCGSNGYVCCEGTTCAQGNACMSGTCRTAACGGPGQGCCSTGTACTGQQVCNGANVCTACGGLNQPCCGGDVCSSGTCSGGSCVACGAVGQPCCNGTSCGSDAVCTSGTCQARVVSAVGGACTNYITDCGSGLDVCITQNGTQWQGGYCSKNCSFLGCPAGASCTTSLSTTTSYCLKDCAWDGGAGGCRAGYVCDRNLIASDATKASCYPACTAQANCPSGTRCESGFCCGLSGYRCCGASPACPTGKACVSGYCQ